MREEEGSRDEEKRGCGRGVEGGKGRESFHLKEIWCGLREILEGIARVILIGRTLSN